MGHAVGLYKHLIIKLKKKIAWAKVYRYGVKVYKYGASTLTR